MIIRGISPGRTEASLRDWKAILVNRQFDTQRHWDSHTRLYGAITTFAPDLDEKVYENAIKPAYGDGDGFTVEGRAAHLRAYNALKREAIAKTKTALVTPIATLDGYLGRLSLDTLTVKFSMNAGCSMCPCSPGFILSNRWTLTGTPVDVWFERISSES